jgi:hypothetical protein
VCVYVCTLGLKKLRFMFLLPSFRTPDCLSTCCYKCMQIVPCFTGTSQFLSLKILELFVMENSSQRYFIIITCLVVPPPLADYVYFLVWKEWYLNCIVLSFVCLPIIPWLAFVESMCVLHLSSQSNATALPHGALYIVPSLKLHMLGFQSMQLAFC